MSTMVLRHFFGGVVRIAEHAAFVVAGFIMVIVGLALGVTMIMLPVGVVVALVGVGMIVGGIFARIDA